MSWAVVGTLCSRELKRFFRQRNRVVGAIGQPLVFWALFAAGLGPTFRMPGDDAGQVTFGAYFFPGTVALIVLFTAIFTTISIIEDRREGFLQSVLVAPIARRAMVLGKLLGGALIALVQGLLFVALGGVIGLSYSPLAVLGAAALMFVLALALTGLGFVIAWRMDSTQGFHAVMSVFLMPMWLLSGAFFPASGGWLGWIITLNPLSYGVAGLRHYLYCMGNATSPLATSLPSLWICWGVTLAFAGSMFWLACRVAAYRTRGDLL